MDKYAVIVAGGSGTRMNSAVPKQFLEINGKPILHYTIKTFLSSYSDLNIILVLPEQHLDYSLEDFQNDSERIVITAGGPTRFHSVKNGLQIIPNETESVIFVHDGVRCVLTTDLIQRCYETATKTGSAIPAVSSQDSIRLIKEEYNEVFDRSKVRMIQTPQTFLSSLILPAFDQLYNESFTDEATVVEASGKQITLIEGEYSNIKVTRPIDLLIAEKLLAP